MLRDSALAVSTRRDHPDEARRLLAHFEAVGARVDDEAAVCLEV